MAHCQVVLGHPLHYLLRRIFPDIFTFILFTEGPISHLDTMYSCTYL